MAPHEIANQGMPTANDTSLSRSQSDSESEISEKNSPQNEEGDLSQGGCVIN